MAYTLAPPGAPLVSPRFQNDSRLRAAFLNSPPMRRGERGPAVARVQQALVDTGIPLPVSTRNGAAPPDGIFGRETEGAIRAFQCRHDLRMDGVVGRQTLGTLDRLLTGRLRPPAAPPTATACRWASILGSGVRRGNAVTFLIDGLATFAAFAEAIRSADRKGHYIYLLGWWLTDSQRLCPNDPSSTVASLFAAAANKGVQIRVLLSGSVFGVFSPNFEPVVQINKLTTGAAIFDDRVPTYPYGTHHQKVLVVKGNGGLVAFCGGVDINPDRVVAAGGGISGSDESGSPLHDLHARIVGPAAHDLLAVFHQRWCAHPEHFALDHRKGPLLGLKEPPPRPVGSVAPGPPSGRLGTGRCSVKVGVTFNEIGPSGKVCRTVRSLWDTTEAAILAARRFIYMEEQYLVNMVVARLLLRALPRIQHRTILIPHTALLSFPDCLQMWARRKQFIDLLQSTRDRKKVRVFFLASPLTPLLPTPLDGIRSRHTYVHAKMYVIDDELAIIGSPNCNRRGWTHDSEAIAAIFDDPLPGVRTLPFAQRLRMALWAEHLNVPSSIVTDGVASAACWLSPPSGARVVPYDQNAGVDPPAHSRYSWDDQLDPCIPAPGHQC